MEKRRLGIPKVISNQRKDFLWMEHKIARETPNYIFALKEDDLCRSCNQKVLNKIWLLEAWDRSNEAHTLLQPMKPDNTPQLNTKVRSK